MQRACKHCGQQLTVHDLAKSKTVSMETDRKESGLKGFRFRCYNCPQCGYEDLFVDVLHLHGEDLAGYERRREQLDGAVRDVHEPMVEVSLVEGPCRETGGGFHPN